MFYNYFFILIIYMNKVVLYKLLVFLMICLIFSLIYLLFPDKEFGGINKIQTLLEEELLEKVLSKKIKENFSNKIDINTIDDEVEKVVSDIKDDVVIKKSFWNKFFDRFYFSIVSGSTLGFGDIYPKTKVTRLLVIIQLMLLFLIIVF